MRIYVEDDGDLYACRQCKCHSYQSVQLCISPARGLSPMDMWIFICPNHWPVLRHALMQALLRAEI